MKALIWRSRGAALVAAVALILAVAAATVRAAPAAAPQVEQQGAAAIVALQDRIEKVAEEIGRCVVTVTTRGKASQMEVGDQDFPWDVLPPDLRRRFEQRQKTPAPRNRREPMVPRGLGSGFILSEDGYIVTNQHVVDGADELEVTLDDHRKFKATVKGQDPRSDLAVIKIEASGLPVAPVSTKNVVKRGLFVLAIGTPFGFGAEGQASVSFGIVSGTDRRLPLGMEEDRYYSRLIQTDAAINPGNSGGPLCDLDGRVIGINVAIASRSGGNQGVGFAIPTDEALMALIERLRKGEIIEYGYMGVKISDPTEAESKAAGAPAGVGAFINNVEAGSPGDKAGLLPADLVTAIDGQKVASSDDLVTRIGRTPVGTEIKLTLMRSGKEKEVTVKITKRDLKTAVRGLGGERRGTAAGSFQWRGLTLRDLTASIRAENEIEENVEGVYIDDVDDGSGAYEQGLRAGGVINQVASTKVKNLDEFKKAADGLKGDVFVNIVGQGPTVVPAK